MEPLLTCGDWVEVETVFTQEDIRVGSVIIFRGCDYLLKKYVLHRVVSKREIIRAFDGSQDVLYQTQGDANLDVDPCITSFVQVYGVVVGIRRDGQRIPLPQS